MERKKATDFPQELLNLFDLTFTATSTAVFPGWREEVRGRRPDRRRDL